MAVQRSKQHPVITVKIILTSWTSSLTFRNLLGPGSCCKNCGFLYYFIKSLWPSNYIFLLFLINVFPSPSQHPLRPLQPVLCARSRLSCLFALWISVSPAGKLRSSHGCGLAGGRLTGLCRGLEPPGEGPKQKAEP